MARVNNRRRYIRHAKLKGLERERLDRVQEDFAIYGGAPGTAQTTITFTNATNTVVAAAHGYAVNDGPFVLINTLDDLPAELEVGKLYWIGGTVNAGDFQLVDAPGGTVVAFTDDGTGVSTLCEIEEDPV